jgi:hypothetical protein
MEYVIGYIKPAALYFPRFNRRVVVGALVAAALAMLAASSYVSRPHFVPALLGDQPQQHSWSASMEGSKSGASATSTFSVATISGTTGGYPTDPSPEGIVSPQAAAAAFDKVTP